jgi:hypothetical protein
MKHCDRCGNEIPDDVTGYDVWVWVVAAVPGEVGNAPDVSVSEIVEDLEYRMGTLPEYLITSDVYARRSYRICQRCKEIIIANPLGKELPRG